jgi:hypothetical protein
MKTVCVRIVVEDDKDGDYLMNSLQDVLANLPGLVVALDMEDPSQKEVELYEKCRD